MSGPVTVDNLRRKLDTAIFEKDTKKIKKIIRECLAADLPDLEGDVQKARNFLDILQGGTGLRKSTRDLRKELDNAIEEGDQMKLNQVIRECEEMNYPELGGKVRKARDILEALGGGRGGQSNKILNFKLIERNLIIHCKD